MANRFVELMRFSLARETAPTQAARPGKIDLLAEPVGGNRIRERCRGCRRRGGFGGEYP